ncbi:MAG: ABC transporter permease [Proteobacteria bacterium]|nr:ABC transporter permease [Pseudomonadota bacterium]
MDIYAATADAFRLLFSGDGDLWKIILLSLTLSLSALLLTAPPALFCAYLLATRKFYGRRLLLSLLQGFLSFPTVVIGLILYILLSRQGPLGALQLLFTPQAILIGQMVIAFPVLSVFALSAFQKNETLIRETAQSLGAGQGRALLTACLEARFAMIAALFAGFGRIISEVGCALIVGGNIAHYTRTIPTAIALDTGKGEFAESIALGIVLICFAIIASLLLSLFQDANAH